MFRGSFELTIDNKGRLMLPVKYRVLLAEKFSSRIIVTRDPFDKCMLLYPMSEWLTIESDLFQLPNLDSENRKILRVLVGSAHEIDMDKTGRILIPAQLREYTDINKTVVVVGQMKKFEIWCKEKWKKIDLNMSTNNEGQRNSLDFLRL